VLNDLRLKRRRSGEAGWWPRRIRATVAVGSTLRPRRRAQGSTGALAARCRSVVAGGGVARAGGSACPQTLATLVPPAPSRRRRGPQPPCRPATRPSGPTPAAGRRHRRSVRAGSTAVATSPATALCCSHSAPRAHGAAERPAGSHARLRLCGARHVDTAAGCGGNDGERTREDQRARCSHEPEEGGCRRAHRAQQRRCAGSSSGCSCAARCRGWNAPVSLKTICTAAGSADILAHGQARGQRVSCRTDEHSEKNYHAVVQLPPPLSLVM